MAASSGSNKRAAMIRQWLRDLDRSQWWPAERLEAWQMRRFAALFAHAVKTSPYYRERRARYPAPGGRRFTPADIRALPILTRTEVQDAGSSLDSEKPPASHGRMGEVRSSGSTGQPVSVRTTQYVQAIWEAITLREHHWQGRDFACRLAEIAYFPDRPKAQTSAGDSAPGWAGIEASGPYFMLDSIAPLERQLEWLQAVRPDYLLTYPTNVAALADLSRERDLPLDGLRQARTKGEALSPEQRAKARDAWGVEVVDLYSSVEVGYMALQGPGAEHYLVQSEAVYLEVLDDSGEPCGPGETGRVVATPLHNFATPLIRYAVGDYAEVGPPSPCGRGHPVLSRILGRVRNMLTLPDGSRIWPIIGSDSIAGVAPIRQSQIIQKDLRRIDAKIVPRQPLTAAQVQAIERHVAKSLGGHFEVAVETVDDIPRSPSGKFEDFRSEVPAATPPATTKTQQG